MIVDSGAEDIVYTNLFTGVHGNYLKPSHRGAGLDPDNLPSSDPVEDELRLRRQPKPRPGRTSGAAGQGIGAVKEVPTAGELVARLAAEYDAAKARPCRQDGADDTVGHRGRTC